MVTGGGREAGGAGLWARVATGATTDAKDRAIIADLMRPGTRTSEGGMLHSLTKRFSTGSWYIFRYETRTKKWNSRIGAFGPGVALGRFARTAWSEITGLGGKLGNVAASS